MSFARAPKRPATDCGLLAMGISGSGKGKHFDLLVHVRSNDSGVYSASRFGETSGHTTPHDCLRRACTEDCTRAVSSDRAGLCSHVGQSSRSSRWPQPGGGGGGGGRRRSTAGSPVPDRKWHTRSHPRAYSDTRPRRRSVGSNIGHNSENATSRYCYTPPEGPFGMGHAVSDDCESALRSTADSALDHRSSAETHLNEGDHFRQEVAAGVLTAVDLQSKTLLGRDSGGSSSVGGGALKATRQAEDSQLRHERPARTPPGLNHSTCMCGHRQNGTRQGSCQPRGIGRQRHRRSAPAQRRRHGSVTPSAVDSAICERFPERKYRVRSTSASPSETRGGRSPPMGRWRDDGEVNVLDAGDGAASMLFRGSLDPRVPGYWQSSDRVDSTGVLNDCVDVPSPDVRQLLSRISTSVAVARTALLESTAMEAGGAEEAAGRASGETGFYSAKTDGSHPLVLFGGDARSDMPPQSIDSKISYSELHPDTAGGFTDPRWPYGKQSFRDTCEVLHRFARVSVPLSVSVDTVERAFCAVIAASRLEATSCGLTAVGAYYRPCRACHGDRSVVGATAKRYCRDSWDIVESPRDMWRFWSNGYRCKGAVTPRSHSPSVGHRAADGEPHCCHVSESHVIYALLMMFEASSGDTTEVDDWPTVVEVELATALPSATLLTCSEVTPAELSLQRDLPLQGGMHIGKDLFYRFI